MGIKNWKTHIEGIMLDGVANATVRYFDAEFNEPEVWYPEGWYIVVEGIGRFPVVIEGAMVQELRHSGHAVIVWTPDELDGANPRKVEDRSIELGWDIINDLK